MMTRKDYRLIAAAIKDADLDAESWRHLMDELIPALHHTNPHFNSARFIEAASAETSSGATA